MEKVTVRIGELRVRVSKDIHDRFKQVVKETVGPTREDYKKSVLEAINNWCNEKQQKHIAAHGLALLEKGFDMGKMTYENRDELYERD